MDGKVGRSVRANFFVYSSGKETERERDEKSLSHSISIINQLSGRELLSLFTRESFLFFAGQSCFVIFSDSQTWLQCRNLFVEFPRILLSWRSVMHVIGTLIKAEEEKLKRLETCRCGLIKVQNWPRISKEFLLCITLF